MRIDTLPTRHESQVSPSAEPGVIVVDDDPRARKLLRIILAQAGYQPYEAPDGLHLIDLLEVAHPRAILLDIMMSWTSGFDLCRAIKSNPHYRAIPICIISSLDECRDIDRGYQCGAAEYLVKPVDSQRLLDWLNRSVRHGSPPA